MAIDSSIYANVQAPTAKLPSTVDAYENASKLAQLGMQNVAMQRAMQTQRGTQEAYANNTNLETGEVNRTGFLSDLAKSGPYGPQAANDYRQQFVAQDTAKAKMQQDQAEAAEKQIKITSPAIDWLNKMPESQRETVWPATMQHLKDSGIDTTHFGDHYDPQVLKAMTGFRDTHMEHLQALVAQANLQKTKAETEKTYSDVGIAGNKLAQDFKDDLDPNKSRGGNLAKNQTVVDSADRLKAMFQQFPDFNIPKAQQTEVISAFGSLLNGGSAPFVSQLHELVPRSIQGDANATMSWVLNKPQGAEQQKFMRLLSDSIDRERAVADSKVKMAQVQRMSSHALFRQRNPDLADSIARGYGINPENIKDGKYIPPDYKEGEGAPVPRPEDMGGIGNALKKIIGSGGPKNASASDQATVKMMSPTGKIKMVPINLKGEAIAAGGKVVP